MEKEYRITRTEMDYGFFKFNFCDKLLRNQNCLSGDILNLLVIVLYFFPVSTCGLFFSFLLHNNN